MRSPIPSDECARACEWASLRLDDQLSDFEEVLLEAHLARCAECHDFAVSISAVTQSLRSAELQQPTFAFDPPRSARGRTFALRAVSAAAAVAVVGVSGLVSLQVSASRPSPGATPLERRVIGLKEHQMDELTRATRRPSSGVRRNLAAAEGVLVGRRPPAPTSSRERFHTVIRTTREGG
jgi:hypothetical protein